ncbi:hypothetical protein O181_013066 [Austropuccinia psidii MF-1]|uniref:DNA helicase n=1 Tax=Austropuccinia psidii MF-1 TaxID=1389203 RepID=A0A9Q3GMV8_9BASI|nr:hypothetical protein [Austropuccinia psidii MF-1]
MSDFDNYFDEDDEMDVAAFDAVLDSAQTKLNGGRRLNPSSSSNTLSNSKNLFNQTVHPIQISKSNLKQTTIFGASQVPTKTSSQSRKSNFLKPPSSTQRFTLSQKPASQLNPRVQANKKWNQNDALKKLPEIIQNKKQTNRTQEFDDDDDEDLVNNDDADSDTDLLIKAIQENRENQASIPMKLDFDSDSIKSWIYSINKPKRKYQFDIVAKALYNNCLVSLPTGLGKTFIAAVVMLNFYRWYPKGKVLFLAPTRPLVQQQIEACHSIAGMPSVDCVSLTGSIPASKRADAWDKKRVIFATPQTVANDLRRGILKPEDVICVVIDEAHRATGGYAYCVVISLLMRFNPHFRVLALTATPGSDPEKVQGVIDNLHIGHVEVRTEESMDIKPYTKNKEIILEKIPLTPDLALIREKWASLMRPLIKQCDSLFYGSKDPAYIHAFSLTSAQMKLPKEKSYLRPNLAVLAKMATAMAKLLEYSITIAYEKMLELKHEPTRCAAGICSQIGYKSLMTEIGLLIESPSFSPHPKMDKMKALIIEFFLDSQEHGKPSRLMVFCHFRDMVTDIVRYLNQESPLITASAFVGQSNDVKGNRGMNQKTQTDVIRRFKNNEFNVLVATSIGEEGLDIGALDCIICYEAQKSPLRMLQRLGRTGRNEDGKVIVLIAEGREDKNWEKAQDQYQHVQNALLSKKVLELYDDCERLVPRNIRPIPVDKMIEIQPYIPEHVEIDISSSAKKHKDKPTRRKRPGIEDIPAGAILGFVSAKDYQVSKSKSEAMFLRTQAALLNAAESQILKEQWSKNTDMSNIQPPINGECMEIIYFATDSPLGVKIKNIQSNKQCGRNITPSSKYATTLKYCEAFVENETPYDTWKAEQTAAFDENKVLWWSSDLKGTGARRPLRLCSENKNRIRRLWTQSLNQSQLPADSLTPDLQNSGNQASRSASPSTNSPRLVNHKEIELHQACQKSNHLEPEVLNEDLPEVEEFIQPTLLPKTTFNLNDKSSGFARLSAFKRSSSILPQSNVVNSSDASSSARPDSDSNKFLDAVEENSRNLCATQPATEVDVDGDQGTHVLVNENVNAFVVTSTELEIDANNYSDKLVDKNANSLIVMPSTDLSTHVHKACDILEDEDLPALKSVAKLPVAFIKSPNLLETKSVDMTGLTASDFSFDPIVSDSDPECMADNIRLVSIGGPCATTLDCDKSLLASSEKTTDTIPKNPSPKSINQHHPPDVQTAISDDDDFPELDPQTLNDFDELEKQLKRRNSIQSIAAVSNDCMPSPFKPQISSSLGDDFMDVDQETLAMLDNIERQLSKKPILPSKTTANEMIAPVTPLVSSSFKVPLRKVPLSSESYNEHSPLVFRSRRNFQPLNSTSDYDHDHNGKSVMLATQMPHNKRISVREVDNGLTDAKYKKKRVIMSESEEEISDKSSHEMKGINKKVNNESISHTVISKSNQNHHKKGKQKAINSKCGTEWALKTGLFDLEASESDDSNDSNSNCQRGKLSRKRRKEKRSSSPQIESENSIDRAFLVNSSSSITKDDNDSPEKSMTAFYRASIMSQHPMAAGKFKGKANRYNGKFKWNDTITRRQSITRRNSHHDKSSSREDLDDQWSFDSFVVPDEETIEFETDKDFTSEI